MKYLDVSQVPKRGEMLTDKDVSEISTPLLTGQSDPLAAQLWRIWVIREYHWEI